MTVFVQQLEKRLPAYAGLTRGFWSHFWQSFNLMVARHRQRRRLLQLEDRLLQDLGLTRDEILREAAKPFWR